MKPLHLIVTIVLAIASIAKLANSCSKREKRLKVKEFNSWLQKIDTRQDSIMAYRYLSTDSIGWMVGHKKNFDQSLDSAIQYYRDNYTSDEKRYKVYLNILYDYKKLSYLYSDWIKASRFNENPQKKEKDYRLISYAEFKSRQQQLLFGMSRHSIDAMLLD